MNVLKWIAIVLTGVGAGAGASMAYFPTHVALATLVGAVAGAGIAYVTELLKGKK